MLNKFKIFMRNNTKMNNNQLSKLAMKCNKTIYMILSNLILIWKLKKIYI